MRSPTVTLTINMPILANKVVVVTGAGRGIGRAVAMMCASEGASVVVNDFDTSEKGEARPAEEVRSSILETGGQAIANFADIADPSGADSVIDAALHAYDRIDAVVNNAGFIRDSMFHKMSHADWHAVVNVHLNGYFYVSRAAAPHFRNQGSGAYVHFISASGLVGSIGQANYASAKMGVVGLSTAIALDMRRFDVRSNCISPWAWTRSMETIRDESRERLAWRERMKQTAPEDVAPLATFLCSEKARAVTGQIFGVRKNELYLFSRSRVIRSAHNSDGWTPQSLADTALPMLETDFHPLKTSLETFTWDPI